MAPKPSSSSLTTVPKTPITPEQLWELDETTHWNFHLSHYKQAIRIKGDEDLSQFESFMWETLPQAINSRKSAPHITAREYRQIVDWKLQRGKFRPSLKAYAKNVDNDTIVEQSTEAFSHFDKKDRDKCNDVRAILEPLLKIRGCGPATASAVLSVMDTSIPFMSDELLMVTTGKKYTKKVMFF